MSSRWRKEDPPENRDERDLPLSDAAQEPGALTPNAPVFYKRSQGKLVAMRRAIMSASLEARRL
jgi:hypothetical protein